METKLIYKDDKKEEYHVYTPQEMEQERVIELMCKKALSLYDLSLELFKKAEAARQNGYIGLVRYYRRQAHECHLRGLAVYEDATRKHLELLLGIGRVEGWELPQRKGEDNAGTGDSNH